MAGISQNLGGGGGGGGGGSLIGTNCFETLSLLARDCFSNPNTSKFLEGEFCVLPESLPESEEDEESTGDDGSGIGGGRYGAGNLTTQSGDFDFKLLGLKFDVGERLLDTEAVGEADFEHG